MNRPVVQRVIAYILAGLMLLMLVLGSLPLWSNAARESNPYAQLTLKLNDVGADVLAVQERLRDLGYFTYKPTMQFGSLTKAAVVAFQKQNGLDQDGVVGGETAKLLFSPDAKRLSGSSARVATPVPSPTPKATTRGKLMEWTDVKKKISRGVKLNVIDLWTNKKYTVIMVGGYNHMDFEPATKKDTATFKSTYGGSWSWSRRPVIVSIGGQWIAASVNGMPHGYETIANNDMYLQCCMHFLNSRTHENNAKCAQHQRCVQIAAGKIRA